MVAAALVVAVTASARAETVSGAGQAIQPYAFMLEGYEVYLLGVDSVAQAQHCQIEGENWACGAAALRQLETLLAEGEVVCESVVGPTPENRMIARCMINGEDLGERLVRSGFGVTIPAETDRYEAAQDEARMAGIGLWQSRFIAPDMWRAMPTVPDSLRPDFPPDAPME